MNILHLTDLHFNNQKQEQVKWAELLWRIAAERRRHRIDFVAVTGDLTSHGSEDEFAMAAVFLEELMRTLGLKKERIGFCAGNHDADSEGAQSGFVHYEGFLKGFCGKTETGICLKDKRKDYVVFSTNTCRETSLVMYDNAYLCEDIPERTAAMQEAQYGILLMHHQPEVIKNQDVFRKLTQSGNIRLILCGHLHPEQTRVYEIDGVTVVNGMGITPHLDFIPAGFQLVHIGTEGKINVFARTMG